MRSIVFCSFVLFLHTGCGKDNANADANVNSSANETTSTSAQESGSTASGKNAFKFKLKDGAGNTAYFLKYDGEDGKLLDGNEKELCRFKRSGTKFKIQDANQQTVGSITGYPGRFKIEDENGKGILEFQQSGDDWKLKNEKEVMMLRIKSRDYGFETEKPDNSRYTKVKVKDGKKSLRDKDEKTLLYTKDDLSAKAIVALGFKALDERYRFGLALAIQINLGQK